MKSLDTQMEPQDQYQGMNKASREEEMDLEIAVKLGTKLLKEAGGLDTLQQAISDTQDPAQVVAKFLVQLILQIKDSVASQDIDLSPNIVLGQDGWIVQMLDLLEKELGLPEEFSEDVLDDVVETFKAMAQGEQGGQPQQGQPQASPQQGAPMPQQGAPASPMMGG